MKHITSKLSSLPIHNKRVLVRADLNVDIHDGTIVDDYRLQALLPTLELIVKHGGKIILLSHMGRPKDHEKKLSLRQLIPWFKKHGYHIDFADNIEQAQKKSTENHHAILLVENLRFFPGEQNNDKKFAHQLAELGDFFVEDGFGVLHRNDTSITVLPNLFPPDKRTIGLLVEKELNTLNAIFSKPKHPFILIIGGAKIATKIPLLEHLLPLVDSILLCPALVFTFLKAQNIPIGRSLYDEHMIKACHILLEKADKNNVEILFPIDYQVAHERINGALSIVDANAIPKDGYGISIGPKTEQIFAEKINNAQTIVFNGLMGFLERPETLQGVTPIFNAMSESNGISIICGGDSVAAAHIMGFAKQMHYLSTGGGATLAYISGEELPGLQPFYN